jgi:hypothetical protein
MEGKRMRELDETGRFTPPTEYDTRVPVAIQDVKAGLAAIDDGRCVWSELIDESPPWSERNRLDFERVREELNLLITRADGVLGLMTRLEERLK